jgi:hypothetical protein
MDGDGKLDLIKPLIFLETLVCRKLFLCTCVSFSEGGFFDIRYRWRWKARFYTKSTRYLTASVEKHKHSWQFSL